MRLDSVLFTSFLNILLPSILIELNNKIVDFSSFTAAAHTLRLTSIQSSKYTLFQSGSLATDAKRGQIEKFTLSIDILSVSVSTLDAFFRRGRKATWSGGARRFRGARPRPETSETIGQPALRHLHVIYSRATEYICLDYPWNKPVPVPSARCPFDATMASRSTDYQETRQMALVCPLYARLHHSRNVTIASSQRRHVTVSFLREKKKKRKHSPALRWTRRRDYFSIQGLFLDHRRFRSPCRTHVLRKKPTSSSETTQTPGKSL